MANVLCVMAHPDDEVLGCGGTLAKHAENGDKVEVCILCGRGLGNALIEAMFALEVPTDNKHYPAVAVKWEHTLDDQRFDAVPLRMVEAEIQWDEEPDIIYTHHPDDLNLDHALTARAVLTAFRPKPGEKPRTILGCEVLSSTEWTFPPAFAPNWFVSLTPEQLQKKISAMECYESELQEWPHPRSRLGIRNLAAYRGQQVGVEAAEAFQILRAGPF